MNGLCKGGSGKVPQVGSRRQNILIALFVVFADDSPLASPPLPYPYFLIFFLSLAELFFWQVGPLSAKGSKQRYSPLDPPPSVCSYKMLTLIKADEFYIA